MVTLNNLIECVRQTGKVTAFSLNDGSTAVLADNVVRFRSVKKGLVCSDHDALRFVNNDLENAHCELQNADRPCITGNRINVWLWISDSESGDVCDNELGDSIRIERAAGDWRVIDNHTQGAIRIWPRLRTGSTNAGSGMAGLGFGANSKHGKNKMAEARSAFGAVAKSDGDDTVDAQPSELHDESEVPQPPLTAGSGMNAPNPPRGYGYSTAPSTLFSSEGRPLLFSPINHLTSAMNHVVWNEDWPSDLKTLVKMEVNESYENRLGEIKKKDTPDNSVTSEQDYRAQVSGNWCAEMQIGYEPDDADIERSGNSSLQVLANRIDRRLAVADYRPNIYLDDNNPTPPDVSDWLFEFPHTLP